MTQLDPVDEFNALKPNSKAHAVYWLRTGELHPEAHHIIVVRLTPWIERVTTAGAEILDKLRALALVAISPKEPPKNDRPRATAVPCCHCGVFPPPA